MRHEDGADVVIAGAGMAGTLFAVLLATSERGRDLNIVLVEPNPFRPNYTEQQFDARVVALTEASRHLLQTACVWEWVTDRRCCPYLTMEVRDTDGVGVIQFDCADVHQPALGHIVESSLIVEGLLEKLNDLDNLTLLQTGIKKIESRSEHLSHLTLDNGASLQARLLVAADGAASPVRKQCGLAVREWPYEHSAIVTTVTSERQHQYRARQWFSSDGPLAFLPLQNRHGESYQCSIVWSQRTARADSLMAMGDEAFCQALGRASEQSLGAIRRCEKRFAFPLQQRHAIDYVTQGVALLGDAAHTIHPLAGQGINLGFKDAQILVEEINRASARGLELGSLAVLGRYQRRRKPDNLAMMAAMEGFKRLFANDAPVPRLLRNEGMLCLNRFAMVKKLLIRHAMGL